ncbi:MAG TPA: YitT family protein [Bacteroidales bacterium]|nr:YitT family protein [Bacteroidales bacterium]
MPAILFREKPFSMKWIISYSLIIIGAFILATSFVLFITPYKIVPGGVYGISIVLHYLLGLLWDWSPFALMSLSPS